MISAEVGVTAGTAYEVAQIFLNMNAILIQTLAALESIRLTAVTTIEDAVEKTNVDIALESFSAGLSAF